MSALRPIKPATFGCSGASSTVRGKHDPKRDYRLTLRPLPEDEGGGYLIEFPDLPGRVSDGATIQDAATNGIGAMRGRVATIRAESHPIPAPTRSPTG
jgi:antitoxin HicB